MRPEQDHAARRNVRRMLSQRLSGDDDAAIDVEIGVFNKAIDVARRDQVPCAWQHDGFRQRYAHCSRTVLNELSRRPDLHRLHDLPMSTAIERRRTLAFLSPQQLCPYEWQTVVERLEARVRHRAALSTQTPMTQLYTCAKCKGRRCVFQEKFSRSADEPAVIHVKCIGCGHSWRM